MSVADVIDGKKRWHCDCADVLAWLPMLPDDSVDLLFTSPPYEAARTYSIGFNKRGQEWVDWMHEVVKAAAPKVKGLIAVNCEGQTRDYQYSATPFLLAADLHRAGFKLRKPVVFHRVGIPGSGGPDWLRNDWEPIICVTRGKLPWSDNTACGKAPKYGPGGVLSNRLSDGTRVNMKKAKEMAANGVSNRAAARMVGLPKKTYTSGTDDDGVVVIDSYLPPEVANPGNILEFTVGGGVMGHALSHGNEAPFPLGLAEFFVKSFCPPDGIVCDPFSGSGTTAHAAIGNGRRFVGCDIRESQVKLATRRIRTVTPPLSIEGAA